MTISQCQLDRTLILKDSTYLTYLLVISPFLPNCLFCWLVDAVDLLENEIISDVMTEWSFCFVDEVHCLYFRLIGLYGNLGENSLLSGHFMFAIPLAYSWREDLSEDHKHQITNSLIIHVHQSATSNIGVRIPEYELLYYNKFVTICTLPSTQQ